MNTPIKPPSYVIKEEHKGHVVYLEVVTDPKARTLDRFFRFVIDMTNVPDVSDVVKGSNKKDFRLAIDEGKIFIDQYLLNKKDESARKTAHLSAF